MTKALMLLSLLLLVLAFAEMSRGQDAGAQAQGVGDKFAAQAADAIDSTLLSVKNGFNTVFEDGSKLSSFFANLTSHFKKLTGQDKEPSTSSANIN